MKKKILTFNESWTWCGLCQSKAPLILVHGSCGWISKVQNPQGRVLWSLPEFFPSWTAPRATFVSRPLNGSKLLEFSKLLGRSLAKSVAFGFSLIERVNQCNNALYAPANRRQIDAVFAALASAGAPLDAKGIAAQFKKTKTSEKKIADVLASLASRLGHVTTDGQTFALRRVA